ncbi:MAG TPA: DUF6585 family protein [Ktedonobacteraceae bacterium]|nr:DUF6585 family protein [Ktedonobacteraceae bacterium]
MEQQMRVLQQQQLPPEAAQLAATYQLGTPQTEYKVGVKKSTMITMIVIGILAGGGFGVGALNSTSQTSTMLVLLGFSLLFIGLALYYVFLPVIYHSWHVYVCTDGFAFTRGNAIEAFRWDQIEAMWQSVTKHYTNGVYTGTTHIYTVRSRDGRKVVLNDKFANVEQLGNTISQQITNYLLPQVVSAYNAGNTITFGPLSISKQGVSNSKELLPWSQIKEMGVNRGVVTVKKEGKWLSWSSVMVAKVPNIFVFMALVNYVLKSQR